MIVILTDDEVREALLKAAAEKTQGVLGNGDVDNCHFDIQTADISGSVEDVEQVQFYVDFG